MSSTPHPYQVTVGASGTVVMGNHTAAIERLPVINSGSKPLAVQIKISDTTLFTKTYPAASWVRWVRPDSVTLAPGQAVWVRVKIVPPPGQASAGTHAFNLTAAARPAGQAHGAMGVSLGIGSGGTIRIVRPGTATAVHVAAPPPAPVLRPPPGSDAPAAFAVLGVLVALLAASAILVRRSYRRSRARRSPGVTLPLR